MTKEQKIDNVLFHYDLIETDNNCLGNITGAMEEVQRFNYWRGFWIGTAVVAIPGVIAFIVFCNHIIKVID